MNIDYCDLSISLSKEVISIFKNYVQNDIKKPESGGIITGNVYENKIEVLNCSEPSRLDQRSRYNYNRSHKSAQIYINEKFEKSEGKEIYLGEWHTHPEDAPIPSTTDIKSFNKTLNKNRLNSDIHFMIIVGIKTVYIGIYKNGKFQDKVIATLK